MQKDLCDILNESGEVVIKRYSMRIRYNAQSIACDRIEIKKEKEHKKKD